MKKSSLFISAVLTTFVLAVLAGAVVAARSFGGSTQASAAQSAPVAQAANPVPASISPQQAAQVAARFIGRTDLYSVESASLSGASAYKVTFSSGEAVYVSPQGQVLAVIAAPSYNAGTNSPSYAPSYSDSGDEHEGGGDD